MKNKKLLLNSVLLTLFLSYGSAYIYAGYCAQNTTPLHYSSTKHFSLSKFPKITFLNRTGSFFEDISAHQISLTDLTTHLNQYFNVGNEHTFVKFREYTDSQGILHQSYQHYYKGIEVDGGVILIHSKAGKVAAVNGQFNELKEVNSDGNLSDTEAVEIVLKDFDKPGVKASGSTTSILSVENKGTVLSYHTKKIRVDDYSSLRSYTYFIDVNSKQIVKKRSNIAHADTQGSATTLNRGTQQITVDSYNGQFRLKDNTRKIHTKNATSATLNQSTAVVSNAAEYTNSNAHFTAINTKEASEIHWSLSKTYDYYVTQHGLYGYKQNGGQSADTGTSITAYYNFQSLGLQGGVFNAAAIPITEPNGSTDKTFMIFGRGGSIQGVTFKPFVALDVAGHEYSHLVVEFNGNGGLIYEGESGALNEAFADFMGTAIDFYVNDNPNWIMGESIVPAMAGNMRSLSDPNAGGMGEQPDTYQGQYWADPENINDNDQGGVHTNSGVGNYWFYLLSMGGSGTNDVGNTYNVQAQTIQKAEKIAYKALIQYLTPNAKFIDARNATVQAAKDLYGVNSPEVSAVENAWYAVNVGPQSASVSEEEMKQGIAVYPNPAEDTFVNIDISLNEKTEAALYDITGKQVRSGISLQQGNNKFDIGGIQAGIYILKFTVNTKVYSQKLVIK